MNEQMNEWKLLDSPENTDEEKETTNKDGWELKKYRQINQEM